MMSGRDLNKQGARALYLAQTAWHRWFRYVIVPLILAVPVAMVGSLVWGIWHWTGAVPHYDEWLWAYLLNPARSGLPWGVLWAPHNGHRIFFPDLVALGLIQLTHWNRQVLLTFNVGVMVVVAFLIVWCVWRTTHSPGMTLWLIAPLSLLLFSWGSYASWFDPLQLVAFLAALGMACCLVAWAPRSATGTRGGLGFFLLALAGAIVASFSFAAGLMLWLAFLPSALAAGWRNTTVWVATAAAVWAAFFVGYNQSSPLSTAQPAGLGNLRNVGGLAAYVLAFLGAPLGFPDVAASLALGVAGLILLLVALAAALWRQLNWRDSLIWFELAVFALLVAGESAYARVSKGTAEALSSRYGVWSSLWWVALCVLSGLMLRAWWPRVAHADPASRLPARRTSGERVGVRLYAALYLAAMVTICAAALNVSAIGVASTRQFVLPMQWHQDCVLEYQQAPQGCWRWYFKGANAGFQTYAALLQREHNAIFATGAVGTYAESAAVLPLIRYYDSSTLDHWTTSDYFAPVAPQNIAAPPGYVPDLLLGDLYETEHPHTTAVYSCLTADGHHMISLQANCDGHTVLGIQGWMYTSLPQNANVMPIYQCAIGPDHYLSKQPDCEGYAAGALLGYVLPARKPG